jgi:hypothetical protein
MDLTADNEPNCGDEDPGTLYNCNDGINDDDENDNENWEDDD